MPEQRWTLDEESDSYRAAYAEAEARDARLQERRCRYGNCVVLVDPETGESDGGWGPVECPCQEVGVHTLTATDVTFVRYVTSTVAEPEDYSEYMEEDDE